MNDKPMPIFLEDIKELLDPQRVKQKVGSVFQLPDLAYKLMRVLGELLKAVIATNEELKKLNAEVRELHKTVDELKLQLAGMEVSENGEAKEVTGSAGST